MKQTARKSVGGRKPIGVLHSGSKTPKKPKPDEPKLDDRAASTPSQALPQPVGDTVWTDGDTPFADKLAEQKAKWRLKRGDQGGAIQPPKARKRPKKDADAPKGAKGPYIFFGMEKRAEILAANPGLSWLALRCEWCTGIGVTEIAKLIGAAWREVSDEEKTKYHQLAAEDKERAARERAAYQGSKGDESGSDDDAIRQKKKKVVTTSGAKSLRNVDFPDGPRPCK